MKLLRPPWQVAADLLDPPARPPVRWFDDPAGWTKAAFGAGVPTDYQLDTLSLLPAHQRVAVRSLHGAGKTTTAAWAILHFATTREAAGVAWKAATTASVWRQLQHYLWPEVHAWARRIDWSQIDGSPFRRGELLDMAIKLTYGEAFAAASNDPASIEGAHAEHVLYVFDEAKAIDAGTWDAAEGAFSTAGEDTGGQAWALAISTPGAPSGRFYDIHKRKPGLTDWRTVHWTLAQATCAGRVSQDWANARAVQWTPASAVYQNRVLGEFAAVDEDSVIPLAWVEAAVERWKAWQAEESPPLGTMSSLGIDVARYGTDRTCMALCYGHRVTELRVTAMEDTTQTSGRAQGILDRHGDRARAVVDVVGLGAGVFDQLRAAGYNAEGFSAGSGTPRKDRSGELGFADCRSAAWWNLREMLDPTSGVEVWLPDDDLLVGDLTAPKWGVRAGGRIKVESKEELRPRIGRSTDAGDAVIQALWPEPVGWGALPDEGLLSQRIG